MSGGSWVQFPVWPFLVLTITKSSKIKKKSTKKSVTNIFIGKSQWFNWNKVFIKVKPYDNMVKWLNNANDSLDDKEV